MASKGRAHCSQQATTVRFFQGVITDVPHHEAESRKSLGGSSQKFNKVLVQYANVCKVLMRTTTKHSRITG